MADLGESRVLIMAILAASAAGVAGLLLRLAHKWWRHGQRPPVNIVVSIPEDIRTKEDDVTAAPRRELLDEQKHGRGEGTYLAFREVPESSLRWTKPGLSDAEIRVARSAWDKRCDEILRELVEAYAWDAHWHIAEAVENHLSPRELDALRDGCRAEGISIQWDTLLMRYGTRRLEELDLKSREPHVISCASCGFKFREWIVNERWVERLGGNVHFCPTCYSNVLHPERRRKEGPVSVGRDEMLGRLEQLAAAMECVPLVSFLRFPDFEGVSARKQVSICKAILAMPPYWEYVDRFGSWLAALGEAGVLEDGVLATGYGTRCLAEDGHECFSLAEKTIDDWLTSHGIEHEKEPPYPYDDDLNTTGLRADWQVGDTLIEYAGLLDDPEYASKMEQKEELASECDLDLKIVTESDLLTLDDCLDCLIKDT